MSNIIKNLDLLKCLYVYVLFQQFTRQIIGFYERIENGETIPMYMGLQICDTISISKIEDIEVF